MLGDGLVLGIFTLAGLAIIWKRLPKGARLFTIKHPLFTDMVLAVIFYSIMGFTLVAHMSAAIMTLGTMLLLEIARNPEKYVFITDSIERAKSAWNQLLAHMHKMNNDYKMKHPEIRLINEDATN